MTMSKKHKYFYHCQIQMACLDVNQWVIIVYLYEEAITFQDFCSEIVHRDDDLIACLVAKAQSFHEQYLKQTSRESCYLFTQVQYFNFFQTLYLACFTDLVCIFLCSLVIELSQKPNSKFPFFPFYSSCFQKQYRRIHDRQVFNLPIFSLNISCV